MPGRPLILALDVGTSSTKAALFTERAERLMATTTHEPYALHVGADGAAELDAGTLERAVMCAIRGVLAARRRLKGNPPIIAVGMSCFWHSLLGKRAGQATPIYTWGDGRCREDAARLRANLSEKAYHARTGCLLRAPYWPAKLCWLKRTGQASRDMKWLSPADWLYGRLAGSFTASLSMASGTGLLDARRACWDVAMLRVCDVREEQLSMISDEPLRPIADGPLPALHRFPELREALWFPALGDGACGNLGSDAVTGDQAALNVGTSGAVRVVRSPRPEEVAPGLFCYQVDAKRALVGGAISNAGNLRVWALRELRLPDDPRAIERALAGRVTPRHGLTVLPFWTVERSPSWPEKVGGTITGLTYATTALDVLQAVTESTYHRLAQITDQLARHRGGVDLVARCSGWPTCSDGRCARARSRRPRCAARRFMSRNGSTSASRSCGPAGSFAHGPRRPPRTRRRARRRSRWRRRWSVEGAWGFASGRPRLYTTLCAPWPGFVWASPRRPRCSSPSSWRRLRR
jgi:gluconokinase